jgi:hypothetical protein
MPAAAAQSRSSRRAPHARAHSHTHAHTHTHTHTRACECTCTHAQQLAHARTTHAHECTHALRTRAHTSARLAQAQHARTHARTRARARAPSASHDLSRRRACSWSTVRFDPTKISTFAPASSMLTCAKAELAAVRARARDVHYRPSAHRSSLPRPGWQPRHRHAVWCGTRPLPPAPCPLRCVRKPDAASTATHRAGAGRQWKPNQRGRAVCTRRGALLPPRALQRGRPLATAGLLTGRCLEQRDQPLELVVHRREHVHGLRRSAGCRPARRSAEERIASRRRRRAIPCAAWPRRSARARNATWAPRQTCRTRWLAEMPWLPTVTLISSRIHCRDRFRTCANRTQSGTAAEAKACAPASTRTRTHARTRTSVCVLCAWARPG